MQSKVRFSAKALLSLIILVVAACNEFQEPLPTAPTPPPPLGYSQFQIVGHWEAVTEQGRRIAFDVTSDGRVINGRLNFHQE